MSANERGASAPSRTRIPTISRVVLMASSPHARTPGRPAFQRPSRDARLLPLPASRRPCPSGAILNREFSFDLRISGGGTPPEFHRRGDSPASYRRVTSGGFP